MIKNFIKNKGDFLAWVSLISLMIIFRIPCLFRLFTGIPCPGCGLTRAYKSFMRGDIKQAFYYHPLFWTIPILIFMLYKNVKNRYYVYILAIFLIIYFYRLMNKTLI